MSAWRKSEKLPKKRHERPKTTQRRRKPWQHYRLHLAATNHKPKNVPEKVIVSVRRRCLQRGESPSTLIIYPLTKCETKSKKCTNTCAKSRTRELALNTSTNLHAMRLP